jgi:hypothetical protein
MRVVGYKTCLMYPYPSTIVFACTQVILFDLVSVFKKIVSYAVEKKLLSKRKVNTVFYFCGKIFFDPKSL